MKKKIAQVLRAVRIKAGKEQKQLAWALGITQPAISKIENGQTSLSVGDSFLWAYECGLTFESLMSQVSDSVLEVKK